MVPTIINIVDGKLEVVLSVRYPEILTIEDIMKNLICIWSKIILINLSLLGKFKASKLYR